MRNTTLMIILASLGLVCWSGIAYLVNNSYPDARAQYAFLATLAGALVLTVTPVSNLIYVRLGKTLGRTGDLARSLRQGLLVGIAGTVMMALQFLGYLRLGTAVILLAIVLLIEVAFALQESARR